MNINYKYFNDIYQYFNDIYQCSPEVLEKGLIKRIKHNNLIMPSSHYILF